MIIEKEVRDYLCAKNIEGIGGNVYMDVPTNMSNIKEYILIQKTGNSERNMMESPVVAIKSISKQSRYLASLNNERVKEAMRGFRYSVPNVFGCVLNTDYDFTNTATKEYRYQSVWQINLIN